MSEEAAKADGSVKVFISYSRRDLAFTERLVEALKARGLSAKIDTRDLPKLEDWRRELLGFIREADAIVFVVSSHSVKSSVCDWEVEQVAALNKRLAPIVLERVPDDRIPGAVAKINYIYFDQPDEFEAQADALAQALQTDLQWVKNHTRLGELAHRWDERGRPGTLALRGQELEEAERWIASHPRGAPEPSELHKSFLTESRRAATRRLRYGVAGSLTVGALAIGLALFAFVQQRAAETSRTEAVRVLATSDFQRGATSLQSDETTAEGMALLARAVRRGQDQRALTRLWTLLQQRGFWFPTGEPQVAATTPPSLPQAAAVAPATPPATASAPSASLDDNGPETLPKNMPQRIKDKFSKFTIKNQVIAAHAISMSANGKSVFTSIGGVVDGSDVMYRVWRADGTAVTNWQKPEYHGLQYVSRTRGYLSPDGRLLALEVRPWREMSLLRLYDLSSNKRIGNEDILPSGPQPDTQNVGFSHVEFIPQPPAYPDELGFLLLVFSEKGGASVYRLDGSGPVELAKNEHAYPVVFAQLDPANEWLMSASLDGTVRVSSVKDDTIAVGNVLQLGFEPASVQRLGANGLSVTLTNGEQRAFTLNPEVHIAPSKPELRGPPPACKRWDNHPVLKSPESLQTARGLVERVGTRRISIATPSAPPLMSPTFAADIVLACLNDAGDRLAITTSDFITEVWAIDFSRRFGLPLSERRLFGTGHRPDTIDMTVLAPDGKTAAIISFFWHSPNLAERWYSFWDLETALPLADRVYIGNDGLSDGVADSVRMDASGRFLAFVASDGENKVKPIKWLQVVPPASVVAWIADFAEAIAGVSLDDQGILVPVTDRAAKLERGARELAQFAVQPSAPK